MKKDIKLIALDLDGTLISTHDDHADTETVEAIKEAQKRGIEIVVATGRARSGSLHIAEALGVDYLITLNGGAIWTTSGELLRSQSIDRPTAEEIFNISRQYQTYYWLEAHDQGYVNEIPDNHLENEWLKFGFEVKDQHDREALIEKFMQLETIELSNSSTTNMELNAKGVHKAAAIQYILDQLDISFDQVMAVGDSLNDLKMIEAAGLGIAMGNAQEPVKEAADWVTETNKNGGVAVAIKRFVLDE